MDKDRNRYEAAQNIRSCGQTVSASLKEPGSSGVAFYDGSCTSGFHSRVYFFRLCNCVPLRNPASVADRRWLRSVEKWLKNRR